jgi:transcription elongation factor GreA
MRVPIRKGDNRMFEKMDAAMTEEKYLELKNKLEFWIKIKRPREAEEVKRLALMGDFSENAGYQMAKGRLRGLNQRIIDTENLLKRAEIIKKPQSSEIVNIGNTVIVESGGQEKEFTILGSSETDPSRGIISHISPLGMSLIGRRLGDKVKIGQAGKEKEYTIKKIS